MCLYLRRGAIESSGACVPSVTDCLAADGVGAECVSDSNADGSSEHWTGTYL